MLRIGLISDTHLHQPGDRVPDSVFRALDGVDLVIHAGDLEMLAVLDQLEVLAPVLSARGYSDPLPQLDPQGRLHEYPTAVLDGVTLAACHDLTHPAWHIRQRGPAADLIFPAEPTGPVLTRRFGVLPQVVVFGDTHVADLRIHQETLFINPGSTLRPDPNQGTGRDGTVARLTIAEGQVEAQVLGLREGFPSHRAGSLRSAGP